MDKPNTGTVEKRAFAVKELRVAAEGTAQRLAGHAAVFNQLSEDFGGWSERIAAGAFAASIAADDIRCLRDHVPSLILGRNRASTLSLAEDTEGLAIACDLPDVSYARDLVVSIERGDISQMSFSFCVEHPDDERWENIDGMIVRTILKAKLFDVSPVTYPAYPSTDVVVAQRSFEAFKAAGATPPAPTGRSTTVLERELEMLGLD